jgi:hypothetical protein
MAFLLQVVSWFLLIFFLRLYKPLQALSFLDRGICQPRIQKSNERLLRL